jgi:DNA mismatch repair protein MutS2
MSLPPLRTDPCPDKTRADLEWDGVLAALAERCASVAGAREARGLRFGETREEVRALWEEAREATRLHLDGQPLPVAAVPDVSEAIERLRVGGVLGAGELRDAAKMLASARTLRRFLQSRRERCPTLHVAYATDPTLDDVADEIAGCFDADGSLADRASPRLKELRGELHAARARMLSRLEDMMTRYASIVQDRFVTEREGRYVIPLRSDAHERFPGIVHATSASGSTLFVEPRAVIPMGNRLKMLEADLAREENAVYARLSALLADALPSVEAAARALARADVRAATAKLAEALQLQFPELVDDAKLDLRGARHPLLALDRPVVPSDLALSSGRAMVVSGPNAGGKTVALKTMGLAALMARAGLPIACDEGSTIGIFDVVLTDIGDDQSVHKNLSTFSAHVKNLVSVLEDATEGALVLLDELAGGTDPREGEALAAGVLDSLCARGGAVAATTHYEGLKALALADERFVNASVGFDLATFTPTFKLVTGIPGSSSALAVARQLGLPATVLERAERFLTREDVGFEAVVQKLHDERAALELARGAAEEREREAERTRIRLEAELAAARAREKRIVSDEAKTLLASLRRARDDLRSAQARLRSKKIDETSLREASRALERVAGQMAIGGELETLVVKSDERPRADVRAVELRKGARVWVPRLRAEAEVIELLPEGNVRVAAGALKLVLGVAELRAASAAEPPARDGTRRARAPSAARNEAATSRSGDREARQTSDNTVDVRGLRADDALSMMTSFLDRSLNEGRRVAFVVHGHGTGALRDAVRKELKSSPYVAHFRAGESGEGGDGVTVVWLA